MELRNISTRSAYTPPVAEGPHATLARELAELAALELEFSDNVVRRFGQRAYEVVRECRTVAAEALHGAAQLKAKFGGTGP